MTTWQRMLYITFRVLLVLLVSGLWAMLCKWFAHAMEQPDIYLPLCILGGGAIGLSPLGELLFGSWDV